MTTHVLIVDQNTFDAHLQYMFIGTGSKNDELDFDQNGNLIKPSGTPQKTAGPERKLISMMADGERIRKGDKIIFYVQAYGGKEGKFFGIFKAKDDGIYLSDGSNLKGLLGKKLILRQAIEPDTVYAEGVTEWEALDEIKNIQSPCQMLWSLIYRKLKGYRGNTMITSYESDRLCGLIQRKNNFNALNATAFQFDLAQEKIVASTSSVNPNGLVLGIKKDILPRLVKKYTKRNAHEAHLQTYITSHIGKTQNLDNSLFIKGIQNLEWIGNEVSCGVGMQRIDVLLSYIDGDNNQILMPIELKDERINVASNTKQLLRYIDWLEQYYVPNDPNRRIRPALICKKDRPLTTTEISDLNNFDSLGHNRYLPLRYVEYEVIGSNIQFTRIR